MTSAVPSLPLKMDRQAPSPDGAGKLRKGEGEFHRLLQSRNLERRGEGQQASAPSGQTAPAQAEAAGDAELESTIGLAGKERDATAAEDAEAPDGDTPGSKESRSFDVLTSLISLNAAERQVAAAQDLRMAERQAQPAGKTSTGTAEPDAGTAEPASGTAGSNRPAPGTTSGMTTPHDGADAQIIRMNITASRQFTAPVSTKEAAVALGPRPAGATKAGPDAQAVKNPLDVLSGTDDQATADGTGSGALAGKQKHSTTTDPAAARFEQPARERGPSDPAAARAESSSGINATAAPQQTTTSTGSALALSIADGLQAQKPALPPSNLPFRAVPAYQSAHVLKIELHPAELGTVTANLKVAGDQLSIEIQVESQEAYRRLRSDQDDLMKSLHRLGYDVDKVTILQPQTAVTRADSQMSASSLPSREQPSAFTSGQGGNGGSGQRPSRNQGHDSSAKHDAQAARRTDHGGIVI